MINTNHYNLNKIQFYKFYILFFHPFYYYNIIYNYDELIDN